LEITIGLLGREMQSVF